MDTLTLDAQPRATGKGAARAVRRDGDVPCVLYGAHTEPVHFRVPALAMRPLIHTSETHRVALKLDGQTLDCILKEVTFDPTTDVPAHADFLALTKGEKLTLTVPVVLIGAAPGVRDGGELLHVLHEVEVRCLPADIPGHLEADISGLGMNEAVHVSDLQAENVEILADGALTVASVVPPRKAEEETTDAAALGDAAEGEA